MLFDWRNNISSIALLGKHFKNDRSVNLVVTSVPRKFHYVLQNVLEQSMDQKSYSAFKFCCSFYHRSLVNTETRISGLFRKRFEKEPPFLHNTLICWLHSDWTNTPELRGCQLCWSPRYRKKSFIDYEAVDTFSTGGGRFTLKSNWTAECGAIWSENHTLNFKPWTWRTSSSIWNYKCDIRPKFQDMRFTCHFITCTSMFSRLGWHQYSIDSVHGLLKEQEKMHFNAQNTVACE